MNTPFSDDHILRCRFSIPAESEISNRLASLSPFEKMLFVLLVLVFAGSTLSIIYHVNQYLIVDVPREGGELIEGVVGSPRFVNPLLATSDADRDLSALIYSGLMRVSVDSTLTPDLAKHYEISEDGLTYRFLIREDAVFHDGTPVTADDVVFTVTAAQSPILKSPRRANWDGVVVQKVSDREVEFVLPRPYGPFLENTTLGILPSHIWKNADLSEFPFSNFNTEPVGSGPFKLSAVKRDESGIAIAYELAPFSRFALGKPYLKKLTFRFYPTENALLSAYTKEEVESMHSITPKALSELDLSSGRVETAPLPRIFGVFMNQNQAEIFTRPEVRRALDLALDKERIVNDVLAGYGSVLSGPIPPLTPREGTKDSTESEDEARMRREQAQEVLRSGLWEFDTDESVWKRESDQGEMRLEFALATSNTDELVRTAEILKEEWDAIGIKTTIQPYEIGDLNQNVIRPRRYDGLLFGEIVGRELDLFAFWHSSQRNDPGLNVALYANISADKLLEDARKTSDRKERDKLYESFNDEIVSDHAAIFLYAPDFIYVVPNHINGLALPLIATASERFSNVYEWFIESDSVWNFFE